MEFRHSCVNIFASCKDVANFLGFPKTSAAKIFGQRQTWTDAWCAFAPAQRHLADGLKLAPDASHEVQQSGGLADYWYLHDGDVLCDAGLVLAYLALMLVMRQSVGNS